MAKKAAAKKLSPAKSASKPKSKPKGKPKSSPTTKPKGKANVKGKAKAANPWAKWKNSAAGEKWLKKAKGRHEKLAGAAKTASTKGMGQARRAIKNLKAKEYRTRLREAEEDGTGTRKKRDPKLSATGKSSEKGKKTEKTSKPKSRRGILKSKSRSRKK